MNATEKILSHMFHSKYLFFRPSSVSQRLYLEEKHIKKIFESMAKSGVINKTSSNRYYLTPTTKWILRNLFDKIIFKPAPYKAGH